VGLGLEHLVLNNAQVLATAFDLTGDTAWRDAAVSGVDHVLGRNAINQSFVTGYGARFSHNQHNRWFDHQEFPDRFPPPPPGSLAGGPNSMEATWDPVAQRELGACLDPARPQFCYIDDVGSWSTNEIAVNWNSTLAWASAFVAGQGGAPDRGDRGPACRVSYRVHDGRLPGFGALLVVTNTSDRPVLGTDVRFDWSAGQRAFAAWGAGVEQSGSTVALRGRGHNTVLWPGESAHILLFASAGGLANADPERFTLDGRVCRTG
jgi:endoglucanase